jgi:hypothetical protein
LGGVSSKYSIIQNKTLCNCQTSLV